MHNLSQKIALLITKSAYLDDTTEMVSYSIEAIITTSITAIISLLSSLMLNCTIEYIIFNICFIPIRIRHKSFHFKKFIQCFICSNLMIIICSLTLKYVDYYLIFTSLFFILLYAHFYFSFEKNKYEALIIALLFTLSLFFNQIISFAILLSVFMNTILILGRLYNEKIIKYD